MTYGEDLERQYRLDEQLEREEPKKVVTNDPWWLYVDENGNLIDIRDQ